MSGDRRPAAPRPVPARNCRAPATSGRSAHATRAPLGRSSAVTSESPSASAIAEATNAGSRIAANGTNTTRVGPSAAIASCELQRQTGLPRSSWPGERDETCDGIREPVPQRLHVGFAAEQGRQRQGQRDVGSVHRPPRREWECARSQGTRHVLHQSGPAPRTARARSRHGAAVVPRAPARSRHGPTGPQWSRALPV